MNPGNHGFALIIDNQTFKGVTKDEGKPLKDREGSDVDFENLKDLWKRLGFAVEAHKNLGAYTMFDVVRDMAKKINENQGSCCFVCCIMTHGAMGKIYGSDCKHLEIRNITDFFKEGNCPALAGKPKLFFIQACRGKKRLGATETSCTDTAAGVTNTTTPGTGVTTTSQETRGTDEDAVPMGTTTAAAAAADDDQYDDINNSTFRQNADPNEAHFLLGYSTAPGTHALLY